MNSQLVKKAVLFIGAFFVFGFVILAQNNQCRLLKVVNTIYLISNPLKNPCTITTKPFTVTTQQIINPTLSIIKSEWDLSLFPDGIEFYVSGDKGIINALYVSGNAKPNTSYSGDGEASQVKEKFDDNYPLSHLFPYSSKTMRAGYSTDIKVVIINTDLSKDSSDKELDLYLRSKGTTLDSLKKLGVTTKIDNTVTIF